MRKEMNSKSKRKWVAGGLAAFASVALLTTGFATWIIGTQNKEINIDGTTVNVDTAKNASIELVMKISPEHKSLVLAETENLGGSDITWKNDGLVGDLTLEFDEIYVLYGDESGFDPDSTKLHFDYVSIKNGDQVVTDTANTVSLDTFGRSGGPFTYIDLPADINLDGGNSAISHPTATTTKYTFPDKNVKFRWGTAFGNNSPCKFYQDYLTAHSDLSVDDKNVLLNTAVSELNAMNTALNGTTINLKATLTDR